MNHHFNHIADELKLPQQSRERIRAQLLAHPMPQEDKTMKKTTIFRMPLIATAIAVAMALTLTAAAAVTRIFRNDILVSSEEDAFNAAANSNTSESGSIAIVGPNDNPPPSLDEMIESERFKSDDWDLGKSINGGIVYEYHQWDSVEVLSNDATLRSRRVSRADGAEKMEYTAENPANLLNQLTGRVSFDLSWMNEHYNYIPDANMAFVVTDPQGKYVSEYFSTLYAKPDKSGYLNIAISNTAQIDTTTQAYTIDSSYDTAYYYTTPSGYEFLITMSNGKVWVNCVTDHTSISFYGAYLTRAEIEDILDHLSFSF